MSRLTRLLRRAHVGWAEWKRRARWRRFVRGHPLGPAQCGLLAAYGIGDHLLVLAFAPAVQRQHGLAVRWVAGNPRYAFLRGLFDGDLEYASRTTDPEDLRFAPRLEGGRFFYAHIPELEGRREIGRGGHHFLDAYRARLGLPRGAPLAARRPPAPPEVAEAARTLEAQGLVPGRTALLGIDATTTPTGSMARSFWSALSGALRAQGWSPVVNAGPATPTLAGVASLPAPLSSVRALAVAAGAVVSVRSGLSDLTCDLACRRAVVYPDVTWEGGSLHEGSTFERYGLAQTPFEVTLREGGEAPAVRAVVEHVAGT